MDWYLKAMRRYSDFRGRAQRAEYWMFSVILSLMILVPSLLLVAAGDGGGALLPLVVLAGVVLGHAIPSLSVMVRRLHDTGRSGWWVLISLVPYVGSLVLLVFMCFDSEPGSNPYGSNPKAAAPPALAHS